MSMARITQKTILAIPGLVLLCMFVVLMYMVSFFRVVPCEWMVLKHITSAYILQTKEEPGNVLIRKEF
jgi:hypothetical protein